MLLFKNQSKNNYPSPLKPLKIPKVYEVRNVIWGRPVCRRMKCWLGNPCWRQWDRGSTFPTDHRSMSRSVPYDKVSRYWKSGSISLEHLCVMQNALHKLLVFFIFFAGLHLYLVNPIDFFNKFYLNTLFVFLLICIRIEWIRLIFFKSILFKYTVR